MWKNTEYNTCIGSAFDANNGKFTAPLDGIYSFYMQARKISDFPDFPDFRKILSSVCLLSGFLKKNCPLSVCPAGQGRDRGVRTFRVLVHPTSVCVYDVSTTPQLTKMTHLCFYLKSPKCFNFILKSHHNEKYDAQSIKDFIFLLQLMVRISKTTENEWLTSEWTKNKPFGRKMSPRKRRKRGQKL